MIKWLKISEDRRKQIIDNLSYTTGFAPDAIEKDYYVTLVLQFVFQSPWANDIVFKGGTSLSKGWGLITRFSEDVDLAIDPGAFGMDYKLIKGKGQVDKLRNKGAAFVGGVFLEDLSQRIRGMGISKDMLSIKIHPALTSDQDPRIIDLGYPTLFPGHSHYLRQTV